MWIIPVKKEKKCNKWTLPWSWVMQNFCYIIHDSVLLSNWEIICLEIYIESLNANYSVVGARVYVSRVDSRTSWQKIESSLSSTSSGISNISFNYYYYYHHLFIIFNRVCAQPVVGYRAYFFFFLLLWIPTVVHLKFWPIFAWSFQLTCKNKAVMQIK